MIKNCIKCNTLNVVKLWDEVRCLACGHDQQPKNTEPEQPVKVRRLASNGIRL